MPVVIDIHTPPSLELLLAFAASRGYTDEAFIRQWYDLMANEYFWCHPVSGNPLNHWPAYFRASYLDRRGKSRSSRGTSRKADDWFPTDQSQLTGAF